MSLDPFNKPLYNRPLSGLEVPTPPPGLLPSSSVMDGRYVELIPLNADDHAADLFEASHGSEEALRIWDYLADGPWQDLSSYKSALRQQTAMHERLYFAIKPKHLDHVCGQASFLDLDALNGVIEIGHIWFGKELAQTRAATEALYLMIANAMDDLGYRRMQWRCNSQNKRSMAAAERLGFRFEGIFYNHLIFKGRNRDTAWFSILDTEWPELKAIFEDWLSTDNFTEDGRAKSSLGALTAARGPGDRRGI